MDDEQVIIITRYVNNLDIDALRTALIQLIAYPESRQFMVGCINEFNRFYRFPIKDAKKSTV